MPYAAEALFNSYQRQHEPTCLKNTRIDVLQEIYGWGDKKDERCICWLNGLAGTGKSTIARTIAHKYFKRELLGATFFFKRGGGDASHAGKFVTTIARQLANNIPSLQRYIREAATERREVISQSLREQWDKLICRPLSRLNGDSVQSSFIIVIDALDECEGGNDIRLILQLLSEANVTVTIPLKFFLTSRPETPIRLGFRKIPRIIYHDLVLHNVSRASVDHDISTFLQHEFREMRDEFEFLPANWPGNVKIKDLVQRANGLFIYAATVCRFIKGNEQWLPQELLNLVTTNKGLSHLENWEHDVPSKPPTLELDEIYTQILQRSIDKLQDGPDNNRLLQTFKQVVGSLAILIEPLSAASLAGLLDIRSEIVDLRVRHLHSVLNMPQNKGHPIRLLHPSFRDFLLDKERCGDAYFHVDAKQTHQMLADSCIRLMSKALKQDICGLNIPGVLVTDVESWRVEQSLPPEIQYACLYWVQHIQKSESQLHDDGQVHIFLQEYLLHWLEVLSLIRKTPEGVHAITSLESIVKVSIASKCIRQSKTDYLIKIDKSPNLHAFIHDAKRFILYNRSIIEEAPLQLYSSALIFAPEESIIRKCFENQIPHWISMLPKVEKHWSSLLQTLEGHLNAVNDLTFSPDGKLVASGSADATVRLWDITTGAALQTLEGHSKYVSAVVFSQNGRLVASTSSDHTVKVWDVATGSLLQTLEGHSGHVYKAAFSPDGKIIASASADHTAKLWDAAAGTALQTLGGHLGDVGSVVFSPDGKLVASTSSDGMVRLWDAATGAAMQTLQMLEGHSDYLGIVAFSPDGKLVASASDECMATLWDVATGAALQTLEGHSDRVGAVAFSPNGKLIASASDDCTVRLWNVATGAVMKTLRGHLSMVSDVVFSPDGKLVASASNDRTIRLWGAATGAELQMLEGHSDFVTNIAFSPDGKIVASASPDRTIRLWDTAAGAALQTEQTLDDHSSDAIDRVFSPAGKLVSAFDYSTVRVWGYSSDVIDIAFSPNRKLVASASRNCTVRLWDATTGAALRMLMGHSHWVNDIEFSPDSKLVASASSDDTVRLWDAATGAVLQTLKGHSKGVYHIAFSPGGKLVASAAGDHTIRLWDVATGAALQTLKVHPPGFMNVVFSPNGKLVASAPYDCTVRLWDTITGAALQTLEGHSGYVRAVAFSPEGKLIVTASNDCTVRLWDTATGAALQTMEGHFDYVNDAAFSPNGKIVASASCDCTARLWDVATGTALQTLEVHLVIRRLSFSNEGPYLETDRGLLSIQPFYASTLPLQAQPSCEVFLKEHWVARGMEALLLLPLNYQTTCSAFQNNTLVLGHASGRVTFVKVSHS